MPCQAVRVSDERERERERERETLAGSREHGEERALHGG
jgi:hypothetical protein